MTEQEAFIAAICEDPEDLFPRLQYADWLEERGDPRDEFIRVQCELADMEADTPENCRPRWAELSMRERELLDAWGSYTPWIVPHPDIVLDDYKFRRGFVERVSCTIQTWLNHGPALVQAAPLLEVRITDRKPSRSYKEVTGEVVYCWWRPGNGPTTESELPIELWLVIQEKQVVYDKHSKRHLLVTVKDFPSTELAHADLSRFCIAWARERAKLPPLS